MSPTKSEAERLLSATEKPLPERRPLSDDEETYYEGDTGSEGDKDILEEEEEREKLITRERSPSGFARLFNAQKDTSERILLANVKRDKRKAQKQERRKQRAVKGESGAMYEMEEGVPLSPSDTSRASSESDRERIGMIRGKKARAKKTRKSYCLKWTCIFLSILMLFFSLLIAAFMASGPRHQYVKPLATTFLSNGTSMFAPTTILVSLDGFRADFLTRGLTPTLSKFIDNGISPLYMLPSFPSLTFPNHYTMVTGLFPESHGIVGNTFWDPAIGEEFYYTDPTRSMQSKWWGGEPLWETAERQGVRAAIHMWPGSEAHIGLNEPAYVDKFNGSEVLNRKVDRILGLLDLPGPKDVGATQDMPRPQLIAAYVPNVDADGHRYGPNSTEIRGTITAVDTMLGDLFAGLQSRNLSDIVNVVVVSDHGMATTSVDRLVQFEDLVDPDEVEHIDGWPLYGIRPKNNDNLERMYKEILVKANNDKNIDVYLRDINMPARYHFSKNNRIAPLWVVPKTGWAIVKKAEFDVEEAKKTGQVFRPRGLHGYDFENPLMRAIFIARGPAFPHKPGSRMEPFQNIQLYNIICDSVGIEPLPNNGTVRLPLKPTGLHSDPESPIMETPNDPPQHPEDSAAPEGQNNDPESHIDENNVGHNTVPENIEGHHLPETNENEQTGEAPQTSHTFSSFNEFLDWLHDKIQGAADWAKNAFQKGEEAVEEGQDAVEKGQAAATVSAA